jgi:hypothetical protein
MELLMILKFILCQCQDSQQILGFKSHENSTLVNVPVQGFHNDIFFFFLTHNDIF